MTKHNDAAIRFCTETLGFTLMFRGQLPQPQLDYAMVKLGTCVIELLQPLSQSGEGSASVLHHFAIAVHDTDATVSALRAKGVEFDQEIPMAFPDL